MVIGYIGNWIPEHSTENDRAWSLNKLGHKVIAFQENNVSKDQILSYKFDLLLYSHTHGWERPEIEEAILAVKKMGIKTVAVHLDLWRKLQRQVDIGKEATWFMDYLFTPDKGLRVPHHFYMRPGIKESSCYLAAPDPVKYNQKVAFIGSYHYHPEYPERPHLIDFLRRTYGDEFILIEGGMRGHDLNVLYRTVPIIVGDSCFSQSVPVPGYYSDRVPETLGRGGLLLHPQVRALENYPLVMWNDYTELAHLIDYYLENEIEAEKIRLSGFNYVKRNDTYTQIMKEVLEIVNE